MKPKDYFIRKMICDELWQRFNQLIKFGIIKLEAAVKVVLEMQDAKHIYHFALKVEFAPIKELAQAVIKTGDAEYIYMFACDVEGAPIETLANGVIKTRNAKYIYWFAKKVKGAPIEELAYGIVLTKNAAWIHEFARDINDAPIEMLVDSLIELRSYYYIGLVLSEINSVNVENSELQKYALEHKDRLLAVIEECTDVDILQRIKANLNDESLVAYVDELIQRLLQTQEENNRQSQGENERGNVNDGVSRTRIHPQGQDKYQQ